MTFNTELYDRVRFLHPSQIADSDATNIQELLAACFATDGNKDPARELTATRLRGLLGAKRAMMAVVRKRTDTIYGEIVAMGTLIETDDLVQRNGLIRHIAVHPDHRRRKLATAVMKALLSTADDLFMCETQLSCSPKRANYWRLYQSLGFVPITPMAHGLPDGQTVFFRRTSPRLVALVPQEAA